MHHVNDFENGGSVPAQKILFATLVKAGKTILFEPGGIVVKEHVAAITIHGSNVDKFRGDAGSGPPPLLPFDRPRRFARHIINHAIDKSWLRMGPRGGCVLARAASREGPVRVTVRRTHGEHNSSAAPQ
jgi:hypothetical protein